MSHRRLIPLLVLAAMGCRNGQVTVIGNVTEFFGDKAPPLAGGRITLVDEEAGSDSENDFFDEVFADESGDFSIQAPRGELIYLEVWPPGDIDWPAASFTGVSGFNSRLVVPDGTLYGMPRWYETEIQELFKGCTGILEGNFIVGQIQIINLQDPVTGESPNAHSGFVCLESRDATQVARECLELDGAGERSPRNDGCYLSILDPQKDPAVNPDANIADLTTEDFGFVPEHARTRTGPSGMFLIPDVPPGLHTVITGFIHVPGAEPVLSFSEVWMPNDGVVPRFPQWVELPPP